MNRREMLAKLGGTLALGGLGGCLGQYEDVAREVGDATTGEETRTTAGSQTTERTRTTGKDGENPLTGTTFELLDAGCGQSRSEASVAFRESGSSVVVTGTIPGSNDCYVAKLVDASYDSETRALDLTVASMAEEGAEACAQCVVEIAYEATVSFSDGGPARVTVTHSAMGESKTVATAEPS